MFIISAAAGADARSSHTRAVQDAYNTVVMLDLFLLFFVCGPPTEGNAINKAVAILLQVFVVYALR